MHKTITALATTLALPLLGGTAFAQTQEKGLPADSDQTSQELGSRPLKWVPGELIVKYKPGAEVTGPTELGARRLVHVRESSGGQYVFQLELDVMSRTPQQQLRKRTLEAVDVMSASEDVEYAQPNYILEAYRAPDDTLYKDQWHYFDNGSGRGQSPGGINLPQAWDITTGDAGVVIAVLDTGILPNHADITGSSNLAPSI